MFSVVPEANVMGNEKSAHLPFTDMNPIPLGGMLAGTWTTVVPVVFPK